MIFTGIARAFSLENEEQYNTIGAFWDEMAEAYGLENLQGLGYLWQEGKIHYAIGLKTGEIQGQNFQIQLPDTGWISVEGKTDDLPQIYHEIYLSGPLTYEIETFTLDGNCQILYYR